ncbi:MAG: phage tail tube protein [Myxococcales bacterium]|nr:phage tail tube protein [Myxococcales bacterium]
MATLSSRITRLQVRNTVYETEGTASLALGGTSREAVPTNGPRTHSRSKSEATSLKCNIPALPGLDLSDLQDLAGADGDTVIVEWDTGAAHSIGHAFRVTPLEVDNGLYAIEISGDDAETI